MAEANPTTLIPGKLPFPITDEHARAEWSALRANIGEMAENARLHVLDVQFLVIIALAIMVDMLDIVEITGVLKVLTVFIDLCTLPLLFTWGLLHGRRLENARQDAEALLEEFIQKNASHKKVRAARFVLRSAQARKVLIRVALRAGLVFVAELVPFAAFIPWWTIFVFLALKDKVDV